ncbi:MAG: acyl carrier protein [Ewingella americana]|jgi:acyl carrier protein|uniref:acyl carrier protein n=1 Tax=Ewingella americana TaxID=41202 RepID=UPI00242CAEB9|nr:acyl carrier protein [Ewingella americana]MCI1678737.1 acyl carrier protein [Ewingella americana]MCI1854324.1 acyl carrier protein [Ewingella americana]MCI1861624.1 acyl carrier protein [Ewingella americana]MCI2140970.1 acyl carrier protein [Ewingella americana]MCI2165085.1 acyl carrier protein [Ewingella americana]
MIDYDEVYSKVRDMLCEAKDMELASISEDMPLSQLKLDSLDYVELMLLANKEFGVTIETDVFADKPELKLRELCEFISQQSL